MVEKRQYLELNYGGVAQDQHGTWVRPLGLNSSDLAVIQSGYATFSQNVSEEPIGNIFPHLSIGFRFFPASDKDDKVVLRDPKFRACVQLSDRRLPKPDAECIGHGNGGPIVVRPANNRILCEGDQAAQLSKSGRYADAQRRTDADNS